MATESPIPLPVPPSGDETTRTLCRLVGQPVVRAVIAPVSQGSGSARVRVSIVNAAGMQCRGRFLVRLLASASAAGVPGLVASAAAVSPAVLAWSATSGAVAEVVTSDRGEADVDYAWTPGAGPVFVRAVVLGIVNTRANETGFGS